MYRWRVQIEQMELFLAVVDHGGMTPAAEAMGMTQPAVSRSMRNFERQLGVALFRPDGRGVEPTEAGIVAHERLRNLTSDWRGLVAELRHLGGRPSAVTIAVPFGTARPLIPVMLRLAANELADVETHIVESASPDSWRSVGDGTYQAAVLYPEGVVTNDDQSELVATEIIATERLYAVGRPSLLGNESVPIGLVELGDHALLLTEPSWSLRGHIDRAFASVDQTPTVAREVGIADALLAFALEGEGVTILPYSNVVREAGLGFLVARPIEEPTIERSIGLSINPELPGAVAKEIRTLITTAFAEIADATRWDPAASSGV